jgi:hypothetical protein
MIIVTASVGLLPSETLKRAYITEAGRFLYVLGLN